MGLLSMQTTFYCGRFRDGDADYVESGPSICDVVEDEIQQ